MNRPERRRATRAAAESRGVVVTADRALILHRPQHWHAVIFVFEKFAADGTTFFNSVRTEVVGNDVALLRSRALALFGDGGQRTLTHLGEARQCADPAHLEGLAE